MKAIMVGGQTVTRVLHMMEDTTRSTGHKPGLAPADISACICKFFKRPFRDSDTQSGSKVSRTFALVFANAHFIVNSRWTSELFNVVEVCFIAGAKAASFKCKCAEDKPNKMTKYKIFFLFSFLLTFSFSFGQASRPLDSSLSGTWYLINSFPSTNDSLVFARVANTPNKWGNRIEFNPSNNFVDAYSSRCGNDGQVHNNLGDWHLTATTLLTTIPISADNGTKHQISHLTNDKLVLKKIN